MPDPIFSRPHTKEKIAVWPRETKILHAWNIYSATINLQRIFLLFLSTCLDINAIIRQLQGGKISHQYSYKSAAHCMLSVLRLLARWQCISSDPFCLVRIPGNSSILKGKSAGQKDCCGRSRTATISTLVVQEFLCNGLGKQQETMALFGTSP